MSLVFTNYSMESEVKYDEKWYDWCVFVEGDEAILERIVEVKYQLHPTFPNPLRSSTDKRHRFPLISNGWGEFALGISVVLADAAIQTLSYRVRLRDNNWPKKQRPARFNSKEEESVYNVLAEGQFRWRKLNTIGRKTGLSDQTTATALRNLETANLARKAHVRSIDQQEMWGATAIVGIMPQI
jgi:transcription initiation factor IIF auxiliary subunit